MKRLYIKKILVSILTIILVFNCVMVKPMQSKAVGTGVLAGYTMAEILALLGVAVSGTVFAVSATGGDGSVPDDFFVEMNARQAGVGDKLKQYCEMGRVLSAGDKLAISEGDFAVLSKFFADNSPSEFAGSFSNTYNPADYNRLKNDIANFCGFTVNDANGNLQNFLQQNSSSAIRCIQTNNWNSVFLCSSNCIVNLSDNNYHFENTAPWGFVFADPVNGAISFSGANYVGFQQNRRPEGYNEILLNGVNMTATQDPAVSLPLVNDRYNILNPGRVMDNEGIISGGISINLPLPQKLRDAINSANIPLIYNLMNVFPISTATNTLIFYPDISAKDFVPSETDTPKAVDFFPLNDIIEGQNSKYTMSLSSFFPFCIPFDVVDFCRQFQATPQAPSITFPFPYITNNGSVAFIEKTFDLSQFDAVAQLVRRLELIAFIVGLAFVTRNFFIRG